MVSGCEEGETVEIGLGDDSVEEAKDDSGGLTAKQAKAVLSELNDLCGDSWCEGDYLWDFKKIKCKFGDQTCTLTMMVTDWGIEEEGTEDIIYWRSCKMKGIGAHEEMVKGEGIAANLTDAFVDIVNECVERIEKNIPPRDSLD